MTSQRLCEWLGEDIVRAREQHAFDLWGYVFMPEHVHLLLWPREKEYSLSRIRTAIKRPVAYKAIRYLKTTQSPLLDRLTSQDGGELVQHSLWQAGGGYDRNLSSPKAIHEALDYMHHNPVRRGLVSEAGQWQWSSQSEWWGPGGPIAVDKTLPTLMP
ncbi:MAG: hypothetical protein WCP21_12060 [Armatimonadota bacterium]